MTESTFTYQPKYERFFYRAFSDYSTIISIVVFVICNLIFIVSKINWTIPLFADLIMIFFLSLTPLKFVYYVSDLKIKCNEKTLEYTIRKFNKVAIESEVQINDIEVKIVDHWFQRHTTYDLKIYHKKKRIIKQSETKNWSKDMFNEIKKQIQILKIDKE